MKWLKTDIHCRSGTQNCHHNHTNTVLQISVGIRQAVQREEQPASLHRGRGDGRNSEVGLAQVWQDGRGGGEPEGILQVKQISCQL